MALAIVLTNARLIPTKLRALALVEEEKDERF